MASAIHDVIALCCDREASGAVVRVLGQEASIYQGIKGDLVVKALSHSMPVHLSPPHCLGFIPVLHTVAEVTLEYLGRSSLVGPGTSRTNNTAVVPLSPWPLAHSCPVMVGGKRLCPGSQSGF